VLFIIAGVIIIISCSFAPAASNPSPQIAGQVLSHQPAGPHRQTSRDLRNRESSRHHTLVPFVLVHGETPRSSSRKTAADGTRELKRTELSSHRRRHTHPCILHRTNHSRSSHPSSSVIARLGRWLPIDWFRGMKSSEAPASSPLRVLCHTFCLTPSPRAVSLPLLPRADTPGPSSWVSFSPGRMEG
jgi:hypothetical protein